jgi:hypothetical protein
LSAWTGDDRPVLADLGYEGEATTFTLPVKKPNGAACTGANTQLNLLQAHARAHAHAHAHARAEQANAVLTMTFKALRHPSLGPGRIGQIAAAALVILHVEHGRTT